MSISDAKSFIKDIIINEELRDALNSTVSHMEIKAIINAIPYEFSNEEFEEAFRNILVNCQSEGQAAQIKEIKQWWDFLLYSTMDLAQT